MKKVYFVRHGESEGNAARVHQSKDTPLSDIGHSQAKMVALRFKNIQAERIIASPYTRARQTAQAIADYNQLELEENALFQERRGPSELIGLSQLSEQSKQIRGALREHLLDDGGNWHYSDEESAAEFVKRTKQALEFLQKRDEKELIVVSHALNIRMILANVLNQTGELRHLYEIYDNFDLNNTSLSVIAYDSERGRWQVICINDHSHL